MHATLIRHPGPDAKGGAGCLHEALTEPCVAAPPFSAAADSAPATQQSTATIIMESLAALALASGGYAG
jgi:hypothetical protein